MFGAPGKTALDNSERRFDILVDSIEDYAIYMLDPAGQIVTWNRGAVLIKGFARNEVIGRHFKMLFIPEEIAAGVPDKELLEASQQGRCAGYGWRLRKSGERFWASFVLSVIRDGTGRVTGFAKVLRDLGEQRRQQDANAAMRLALEDERDSLNAAAECTLDSLYVCSPIRDAEGNIADFVFAYLNGNAERGVGMPRSTLIGGRMSDFFPSNERLGLFDEYREVMRTGEPLVRELRIDAQGNEAPIDGDGTWRLVQAVKLRDRLAITISDINARKREELRNHHAAHHDHLTGLPNRSLLDDRLCQAIERAKRYAGKVAVYMIDLDSFKAINDTFGHAVGDGVLLNTAIRLTAAVRATDSVIRIGGDEFVMVMPDMTTDDDPMQCANKLLASLQRPMEVNGHTFRLTCSIGISIYPDCASTMEGLLEFADVAMYRAKRAGKNQCEMASGPEECRQAAMAISGPRLSFPLQPLRGNLKEE